MRYRKLENEMYRKLEEELNRYFLSKFEDENGLVFLSNNNGAAIVRDIDVPESIDSKWYRETYGHVYRDTDLSKQETEELVDYLDSRGSENPDYHLLAGFLANRKAHQMFEGSDFEEVRDLISLSVEESLEHSGIEGFLNGAKYLETWLGGELKQEGEESAVREAYSMYNDLISGRDLDPIPEELLNALASRERNWHETYFKDVELEEPEYSEKYFEEVNPTSILPVPQFYGSVSDSFRWDSAWNIEEIRKESIRKRHGWSSSGSDLQETWDSIIVDRKIGNGIMSVAP
ncbi:MAG: hypothetical protein SVV03_03265 [Candidatus Nanohaloarchaea archaeon]|nr:hypothetical protein [Candidatus Nanohaloarchaea archaeon]